MIRRRTAVAVVAACLCAGAAEATTFRDRFVGPPKALGDALAQTVARSLPVTSASPGLAFTYDPSSGGFARSTDLLGQLYLERAEPIGRGKWNLSFNYQRIAVDGVQGQGLDGLQDTGKPIIVGASGSDGQSGSGLVKFDRYAIDLVVNEFTLGATYGLSDDIDVNLTLPVLASRLSVGTTQRRFTLNQNVAQNARCPDRTVQPNGLVRCQTQRLSHVDHAAGPGDLLLRGKYRFVRSRWGDVATGLVIRMPTGNQDNFQGTGTWEVSPLLYASTHRIPVWGPVAVQGFVNGGVDLDIEDVDNSEGRFGAGIDLALGDRATLSVAFLGREPFQSFVPAGFFDAPRVDPQTRARSTAPIFGLETVRPSYYSLSIGGRVNLWRDTIFGFANVLLPLNDEGIHTAPIPLVGFEATF